MNLHSNGGMRIDYKIELPFTTFYYLKQTLNIEAPTHGSIQLYFKEIFMGKNYSSIIIVQVK